jgi:endonuclease/exonuclease/phosphatase family metal-dependent hydrolase
MTNVNYSTTLHANFLYRHTRAAADWLRKPFYKLRPKTFFQKVWQVPLILGSLISSLPFRFISMLSSPGFVKTTTNAEMKEVSDKISILSYNILGMPSYHAGKENRPPIEERIENIIKIIRDSNADVVMLQEVHAGSELEKKLIEALKDKYATIYHDAGPKTFFHGSGLMTLTKYKNTSFTFDKFKKRNEIETKKGIGVLEIKDSDGNAVVRIANTHLQSGGSTKRQATRKAQAQQIVDTANQQPKIPFFFGGDLNIPRGTEEYEISPIKKDKTQNVHYGFSSEDEEQKPTLTDYLKQNEDGTWETLELPVDNIIGIFDQKLGMVADFAVKQAEGSNFNDREKSPSDHAAMLATVQLN